MQQWDRDTSGRLNRISTQPYLASEVSAQTDTMDPIPEEQQSQPGTPMNPNVNRTMRDHIHPPRVSAPSCIVPPADDVAVRPYLVPLLPTYHGMENENPYTHLRDFEEVCTTFKEGMMDMDLLKLKAFPLTLKDKAKMEMEMEMEMRARLSTLARKVEELEGKQLHEVQALTDNTAQPNTYTNFQSPAQPVEQCSMTLAVKDLMSECAHTVGQFKPQQPNAPYGNTYNPNWRNHPNLAWRPNPPVYVPPGAKPQFGSPSQSQQPPPSSPVEQAVLNLSKVVGNFVNNQNGTNEQLTQRIDTVEKTMNKKFDDLQYSNTNINKLLEGQEKGRFPSQTLPNPKGIHEVGSGMDEVKSIITLRSGKEVDQPLPKPVEESRQGEKMQPEHILLEDDTKKYHIPPPFPQALRGKKKETQQAEMLEVLRQVKVNIPLLDLINQVPAYAKFLKDLCTIKRGLGIEKKAFLTEHVSALIQSKYPVKYKDPGSPTIPVNIGGNCIEKALLDLGASVNLMPYSVYKQLGLGELEPTTITLSLADRSVKIPKGIVEDVLVKINNFYYPVDFVVLDTAPSSNEPNHVPIILGRPFLATANAIINCRNGIMQLTFGDMILELNIFNLKCNPTLLESENPLLDEVVSVDQCAGTTSVQEQQRVINLGDEGELVLPATPIASQLLEPTTIPEEQSNLWPPNIMEPDQATAWVEEIILLDPP